MVVVVTTTMMATMSIDWMGVDEGGREWRGVDGSGYTDLVS